MCDKHWVIDKIEKLEIKNRENDVIIISFEPELWTLEDAIETFDAIEAKFPNHNFIGTAKGIDFSVENIDSMIAQLEEMKERNKNV
jgi:primosomal protein N''